MKLGVIEYIDSAHYLPGHEKCGVLHGHTYRIEVVIEGEKQSGMLIDFSELKRSIREALALFGNVPKILETPKDPAGEWDRAGLAAVRRLAG